HVHDIAISSVAGIDVSIAGAYGDQRATATVDGTIRGQPGVSAQVESPIDVGQLLGGHDVPITADLRVPSFDLARLGHLGGSVEATASVRGTVAHPTVQSS